MMTRKTLINGILSLFAIVWGGVGVWLMLAIPYYIFFGDMALEDAAIMLLPHFVSGLALMAGFLVNDNTTETANHPGEEHVT